MSKPVLVEIAQEAMDTTDQSSQDSGIIMNNSTSVLHKIANLYAEQLMSDIILVVGEHRYPAHRVILCASSEVFQVMLMNPEWNECRESVIELKEEPHCCSVFPQFLKYLYVGQIRISLHTVMPMLALADKYNINDLVQLCVDYMLKHVAKAATQGSLVSWLHYTLTFSPYHDEVTETLQRFLKWNLDILVESADFLDIDVNILIVLLQQNDVVIKNEYELFRYTELWVMHRKRQIDQDPKLTDEQKRTTFNLLIESLMVHIRFPMMSPSELAKLLMRNIVKLHTEFFVNRISIGMTYHSGLTEQVARIRATEDGALQFTPRLYTSDTHGVSLTIGEFEKFENYASYGACFFSQSNLSEYHEDQNMAWHVDFFPRGVCYNRAKLINIYNNYGAVDIPQSVLKIVRLSVTCKRDLETEQRFKVGVLITGVQNKITYIRTVHTRTHYFSNINRILNIDNLLPYDELELSSIRLSSHLIGPDRNILTLQVTIAPMGPYICHDTPLFEFK